MGCGARKPEGARNPALVKYGFAVSETYKIANELTLLVLNIFFTFCPVLNIFLTI